MSFGNIQFSDDEFNAIQAALRRRLGPDFVASRPGPGGQKLFYVEGWRVVQLANQTFGFDGWSYSVTNMTCDFCDLQAGKFSVGVSATVRVTLKNGSFREDVGYGSVEGMRSKCQALEKSRKESVTDGLKRAMKSFGNLLGNCLNDKQYMKHVASMGKTTKEEYTRPMAEHDVPNPPNSARTNKQTSELTTATNKRTTTTHPKENISAAGPSASSAPVGPSTAPGPLGEGDAGEGSRTNTKTEKERSCEIMTLSQQSLELGEFNFSQLDESWDEELSEEKATESEEKERICKAAVKLPVPPVTVHPASSTEVDPPLPIKPQSEPADTFENNEQKRFSKTPVKLHNTKGLAHARSSPRLSEIKRRRVNIPGLTDQ